MHFQKLLYHRYLKHLQYHLDVNGLRKGPSLGHYILLLQSKPPLGNHKSDQIANDIQNRQVIFGHLFEWDRRSNFWGSVYFLHSSGSLIASALKNQNVLVLFPSAIACTSIYNSRFIWYYSDQDLKRGLAVADALGSVGQRLSNALGRLQEADTKSSHAAITASRQNGSGSF